MTQNDKVSNVAYLKWFTPVIKALRELGGSATPKEVESKITELENVPEEVLNETREKSGQSKFSNEVAWAKKYLLDDGYIDGSQWGIWKLTDKGFNCESIWNIIEKMC